ncbi:MAG: hypothetical protein JST84_05220 [Acidobacteria bacterium]|nr:hypothetical protein [Acidobacteriota bacterium]
MIYFLIPQNLFSEIFTAMDRLVEFTQAQEEESNERARNNMGDGAIVCYSSIVSATTAFTRSIQSLTQIGLNPDGLPCRPVQINATYYLLYAETRPHLQKALHRINLRSLAEALSNLPAMEVPSFFTVLSPTGDRVEIEHWDEESALEQIRQTPWLAWEEAQVAGTRPAFAVGSIMNLPPEAEYGEEPLQYQILDTEACLAELQAAPIELPAALLDMTAIFAIQAQVEGWSNEQWLYTATLENNLLTIGREVTVNTAPSNSEIPF